ncbi:MAG: PhzF family phenazine biosynthesis protein [Exilispira sp.]|jgi:PhzF family phenazine biosynthesis protein|nr:PhzF family phenazine biosynthesis protein [Exilispira sp.]
MQLDIFQVDAFTKKAFRGNPAGVCIVEKELSKDEMQNIAMEMAVSETAFLSKNNFSLRWFTPHKEIELCGHATLATAWVLFCKKLIREDEEVKFNTLSGLLAAKIKNDQIILNFPLLSNIQKVEIDNEKIKALGLNANEIEFYGKVNNKEIIEIKDYQKLISLKPNFDKLLSLDGRGIIVTVKADKDYDFISRYFAPWVGVNEDPVTGSAHCALAYYWNRKLNKTNMVAYQASKRGGEIIIELLNSERVLLIGNAIITIEGKITF